MSFLNLAGFTFLALMPVIIFFYLLKLRRRPQVVPSTLLWQRAVEDLTANAPFQKLRKNLLLYLQLLILALLVFALARPLMNLEVRGGRSLIVLLDNSASMQTQEGDETRFDQAIEKVEQLIEGLSSGDSMMLIEFARTARVVASFSSEAPKLRRLLGTVKPTHETTNPRDALLLAKSLARKLDNAEIAVISDGSYADTLSDIGMENIPLRFLKVGQRTDNVGFTRVDLRRAPESERDFQLFAEITNYTLLPKTLSLEIYNNDTLIDARQIRLEPDSTLNQLIENSLFEDGEIVLTLNTDDPFPLDDTAYLVMKKSAETKLLLVGPPNYFLEKAIRFDRDLNAKVTTMSLDEYPPDRPEAFDVTIFDTVTPEEIPQGNYLYLGATPFLEGFEENGVIPSPPIYDWDSQHPVMRYVELSDVAIAEARDVTLPAASQTLASTANDRPLVAFHSAQNRNVVVVTFNLFDSNLPLRMAFPLFISNSLNFLSRNKAAGQASLFQTGQTVELDIPLDVETITVLTPGEETVNVERGPLNAAAFDNTRLVGFYDVALGKEATDTFGVNLLNKAESNIEPADTLTLDNELEVEASELNRVNTEVWPWFALAGLLFLLLEWIAYHRRYGV
jgi:hypothetical protein